MIREFRKGYISNKEKSRKPFPKNTARVPKGRANVIIRKGVSISGMYVYKMYMYNTTRNGIPKHIASSFAHLRTV